MKKLIIAVALVCLITTGTARAQVSEPVDLHAVYIETLTKVIDLLLQQVAQLQAQLAALQEQQALPLAPAPEPAPATEPTDQPIGASDPEPEVVAVEEPEDPEPKTATVTAELTSRFQTHVTIKNDTGVAIRIKSLDANGAEVQDFKINNRGSAYPLSITDIRGVEYPVLTCDGVGSLGTIYLASHARNYDPCSRFNLATGGSHTEARNELKPGETMTIRIRGGFRGFDYVPGGIVEVETGRDVMFESL